jgi:hypothetical protein
MPAVPDQAQELRSAPPGRRPRVARRVWIVVAVVAGLVFAAGLVVLGAQLDEHDGDPDGGDRTVSGPRDGRNQATLVLLDGASSIAVHTRDLGDRLFQVETPAGGAHRPVVAVAGDEVRLELADREQNGVSAVEVELSAAVRWQVRILGGSTEQLIDLAEGRVSGVELTGGATRIELTLPPPAGTTTVRMSGGAGRWTVHQVGDAPVRVLVGGGAGSVTIDGTSESGVGAGTVFSPPGWDGAEDRVDIDAVAGMSTFVLDRR